MEDMSTFTTITGPDDQAFGPWYVVDPWHSAPARFDTWEQTSDYLARTRGAEVVPASQIHPDYR